MGLVSLAAILVLALLLLKEKRKTRAATQAGPPQQEPPLSNGSQPTPYRQVPPHSGYPGELYGDESLHELATAGKPELSAHH